MKLKYTLLLSAYLFIAACGKKSEQPQQNTNPPGTGTVVTTPEVVVYHKDGEVSKLYNNTPNGVNIVILGDGFVKEDLKKDGVFDTQVKKVVDYLFSVAPFKQYKQYFNTTVVYAESKKQGAGAGSGSADTKFGSFFSAATDRLLLTNNYSTCYDYVEKAMPRSNVHLVVLLVNDSKYGGSGGNIAVLSTHELSKYVMVHEVGHTFCALGDEYIDEAIADNYSLSRLPYMDNIDMTVDPKKTKWSHFVGRSGYAGVSTFEGAYYRKKDLYRPENFSLMSSLGTLNFNAPSRESIVKRICSIIGIPYNFENFLKQDVSSTATVSIKLSGEYSLPKNDFLHMDDRIKELKLQYKEVDH